MTFQDTLHVHLNAIQSRYLETYKNTLLQSDKLMVILPNGIVKTGYEEIVSFHKSWFEDMDWSIKFTLKETTVFTDS